MTAHFNFQEATEMIYDKESEVEGNGSEYNDSEGDNYSSDDGDHSFHSGESESSSVESIESILAESDVNRPPQATGRGQVIGGKKEKEKERASYLTCTVYSAMHS